MQENEAMTEVEELKVKLEEQKKRIELLKTMMQNLGDISKSEKAKEYFTLLQKYINNYKID